MNILFWTNSFWPKIGGIETQGLSLMQGLVQRGHNCVVITQHLDPASPQKETLGNIKIHRYRFDHAFRHKKLALIQAYISDIKNIVTQFKPDIMHISIGHGTQIFVYRMIRQQMSLPSLVTLHDPLTEDTEKENQIYQSIFSLADQLNCVSNSALKEIKKFDSEQHLPCSYIYNGLDIPKLTPKTPCFDSTTVLCWGRLVPHKGFDLVIRALYQLATKDLNLLIVGEGSEAENLKQLSKTLGLEKQVKFFGLVEKSKLLSLINSASLVVMPSRFEPFGLVAVEAMQMARPIIASREQGLAEIIRDHDTGILVEKNNVDQIAQAITYLLTHPEEAIAMGKRARLDVIQRFNLNRMITEYENLYEKTILTKKRQRVGA